MANKFVSDLGLQRRCTGYIRGRTAAAGSVRYVHIELPTGRSAGTDDSSTDGTVAGGQFLTEAGADG